jgi:hypothetical protein
VKQLEEVEGQRAGGAAPAEEEGIWSPTAAATHQTRRCLLTSAPLKSSLVDSEWHLTFELGSGEGREERGEEELGPQACL